MGQNLADPRSLLRWQGRNRRLAIANALMTARDCQSADARLWYLARADSLRRDITVLYHRRVRWES